MLFLLSPLSSQATVTRAAGDTCAERPSFCVGVHPLILPLSEPFVNSVFSFYIATKCDNDYPGLPHIMLLSYNNQRYNGVQLPVSLSTLGLGNSKCFLYVGNGTMLMAMQDKVWEFGLVDSMLGQTFYIQGLMLIPDTLNGSVMDAHVATTELLTVKVMLR